MDAINKELSKEQLVEITGGNDQMEEFDWQNGCSTKRKRTESNWSFSAEGNIEGQFFKKTKSEIIEVDSDN